MKIKKNVERIRHILKNSDGLSKSVEIIKTTLELGTPASIRVSSHTNMYIIIMIAVLSMFVVLRMVHLWMQYFYFYFWLVDEDARADRAQSCRVHKGL